MRKSELLQVLQTEIRRHTFDTFVDEPPSIAKSGKGLVVPGCPACRKRINTMAQFADHLADEVLPALVDRLSRGVTSS
jgi:hypothetical protein